MVWFMDCHMFMRSIGPVVSTSGLGPQTKAEKVLRVVRRSIFMFLHHLTRQKPNNRYKMSGADIDIAQRKAAIEQRLEETGEKDRLLDYLRQKLIESGWKDELKNYCKDLIRTKGLDRITV